MKQSQIIASILIAVASLTGCKQEAAAPKPVASSAPAPGDMANMPMATEIKHGAAAGTVTAIDPAKGTITLDHGAMSGIDWPAMKMGFSVKPGQLAGIKVGDKVAFEIDWDGKVGTVTKIGKSGN